MCFSGFIPQGRKKNKENILSRKGGNRGRTPEKKGEFTHTCLRRPAGHTGACGSQAHFQSECSFWIGLGCSGPSTSGPREGHPRGEPSTWKPEALGSSATDVDLLRAKQDQSTGEKAKEIGGPPPEEVSPWMSRVMGYDWAGTFLSKKAREREMARSQGAQPSQKAGLLLRTVHWSPEGCYSVLFLLCVLRSAERV